MHGVRGSTTVELISLSGNLTIFEAVYTITMCVTWIFRSIILANIQIYLKSTFNLITISFSFIFLFEKKNVEF